MLPEYRPVKQLNDFVDYVWSFYGEHETLSTLSRDYKRETFIMLSSSIKRELRRVILNMFITHGVMEIVLIVRE